MFRTDSKVRGGRLFGRPPNFSFISAKYSVSVGCGRLFRRNGARTPYWRALRNPWYAREQNYRMRPRANSPRTPAPHAVGPSLSLPPRCLSDEGFHTIRGPALALPIPG